jgi:hypothetical protein
LNEITGKLLAAPISVAALAVLNKISNETEFFAGCLGVFLAFLLYRVLLINQIKQITRLQSSYRFILDGFFVRKKTLPPIIKKELDRLEKDADEQKTSLRRAVHTYILVAYVPIAAIVSMFYLRFRDVAFDLFYGLLG